MKSRHLRKNHTTYRSHAPHFIRLMLAGALSLPGIASATILFWDQGHTLSSPSGGTGTWNTSSADWYNGSTDILWPNVAANDDKAWFTGTAGTVTLGASLTAGGLQFNTSGYILSGAATDLTLNSNALGSDAIVVNPGVSNITIGLRKLILTNGGSGNIGDLINTDKINFGSTIVAYSGSRQFTLTNSTATDTTTITNLAGSSGTGTTGASLYLNQGNLTITNFATGSAASALAAASSTATNVGFAFRYNGTDATKVGTITITGNNTLLNNAGTGNFGINFLNPNATYDIQHNNALGARDASNVLTDTFVEFNGGILVSSNGPRTLENAIIQTGTFAIGGSNAINLSGTFTNSGGNRTLTSNSTALTTLSGAVYLANDDATARTLTVSGTGNTLISGSIANNNFGNTVASGLTKTGTGTLILSGNNTYTGATTVSAGTLLINGSLANSAISLSGTGSIGGDGSYAGSVNFAAGTNFAFSTTDTLDVGGTVSFGGFGIANLLGLNSSVANGPYTLINGTVNFDNVSNVGPANAADLGNGKFAYFQQGSLQVVVIPEPGVGILGAIGMLALLRRKRR